MGVSVLGPGDWVVTTVVNCFGCGDAVVMPFRVLTAASGLSVGAFIVVAVRAVPGGRREWRWLMASRYRC